MTLGGLGIAVDWLRALTARPARRARLRKEFRHLALSAILSLAVTTSVAAPEGVIISNTAEAVYAFGSVEGLVVRSNEVSVTTVVVRTPANLELLQFAPTHPDATPITVHETEFSMTGQSVGPYSPLPPPVSLNADDAIVLGQPLPLVEGVMLHQGEPVFIVVTDPDQNLDALARESVKVRIETDDEAEKEWLLLWESGPSTGIFTGYAITAAANDRAGDPGDGVLVLNADSRIYVNYMDSSDPDDVIAADRLVDSSGVIFDSSTGLPIDGVSVTLIDVALEAPAVVYGDDGVSRMPSTLTSGGNVTDSGGREYRFEPGRFRFPVVAPGTYRLEVEAPVGFGFPTVLSEEALSALPGGPYFISDPGMRGETFDLLAGSSFRIDLPLDPTATSLFVAKTASKAVVEIGDVLEYSLTVENATSGLSSAVELSDLLPPGFAYMDGSAHVDSLDDAALTVSDDGRMLTFSLGDISPGGSSRVRYVVEVGAGAVPGPAVNRAHTRDAAGSFSNEASAVVLVKRGFFADASIIIGHVTATDSAGAIGDDCEGLGGVRIYLEDGTFVVTDARGRFHFEGVRPGTHVVQLDTVSLPEGYEALADGAVSRFVDLKGGTLWRTDFLVGRTPPPMGRVSLRHEAFPDGEATLFRLRIDGSEAAAENLRLLFMLPDGVTYETGSSEVDGNHCSDPESTHGVLTYRLGDNPSTWTRRLALRTSGWMSANEKTSVPKVVLLFDAAGKTNRQTPLLNAASGAVHVDFELDRSGAALALAESENGKAPATPVYDEVWLETAAPGLEWLWPPAGHLPPIPSLKLAIKHEPIHRVDLLLDGEPVNRVSLDGILRSKAGDVALSLWSGVDLHIGDNRLEIVVENDEGLEVSRTTRVIHYSGPPVRVELVEKRCRLIADGRTPPVVAVRLLDQDGHPARRGTIGTYSVLPPHAALQDIERLQTHPLARTGGMDPQFVVGKGGIALVELQPTSRSGEAAISFHLSSGEIELRPWLRPAARDWILVGLAEGQAGYATISEHMETSARSDLDEDLTLDGRVAFFAKGRIRGDWLLSLAYDSEQRGAGAEGELFQTLDPDAYYPLYGDATLQGHDGASTSKLYLKLEREQFYVLFGDYDTGLTVTDLSRYRRALNGFKTELQSDNFGLNAFASHTDLAYHRDEIRGNGTSGPYRLSRSDLLFNSEKISIETRDRFHSERILTTRTLTRHLDYNVDYGAGILFFKEVVPGRDAELNPITIVAEFESRGENDRALDAGGRGFLTLLDRRLVLGATRVREGALGSEGNLWGTDVALRLGEGTELRGEFATSEKTDADGRREGVATLAELNHVGGRIEGRLRYREQEEGFGLGHQNRAESGLRKLGVDFKFRPAADFSIVGEAWSQTRLADDARREVAELGFNRSSGRLDLRGGFRHAGDELPDGGKLRSSQVLAGATLRSFAERLRLRLDHEQSLGGDNANPAFPTRTRIGAELQAFPWAALFGEHEIARGEHEDADGTRMGVRATPWEGGSLASSVGRRMGESGARIFANLGLTQKWWLSSRWSADFGLDHSRTLRSESATPFVADAPVSLGADEDYTAISLGAAYRVDTWSWAARIERRDADASDRWGLMTGALGEPRPGLALSADLELFATEAAGGVEERDGRIRFGAAYRPAGGRWTLLDRLDLATSAREGEETNADEWRIVNNLNANYASSRRWQLSLQMGSKLVREQIRGVSYGGFTELYGLEARYDLGRRWDAGLHGNVLHSWKSGQFDYRTGASVGYKVVDDAWLSVGYNFRGFEDRDFSGAGFTARGPFVQFRLKFDQNSLRNLLGRFGGSRAHRTVAGHRAMARAVTAPTETASTPSGAIPLGSAPVVSLKPRIEPSPAIPMGGAVMISSVRKRVSASASAKPVASIAAVETTTPGCESETVTCDDGESAGATADPADGQLATNNDGESRVAKALETEATIAEAKRALTQGHYDEASLLAASVLEFNADEPRALGDPGRGRDPAGEGRTQLARLRFATAADLLVLLAMVGCGFGLGVKANYSSRRGKAVRMKS